MTELAIEPWEDEDGTIWAAIIIDGEVFLLDPIPPDEDDPE